MSHKHDNRYKKLFSNPTLVKQLLECFVNLPFVKELDYSTLKKSDKSFVTHAYKSMESDIIYTVNYKGKTAYIYLLIEFQSTIDHFMSLRMLRYILELYDEIIKTTTPKPKKLPAVFPIMLYNGNKRWDAPENISELIDDTGINRYYIPSFKYYKIDEENFSKETLIKLGNGISAIFYAEQTTAKELKEQIYIISDLIKNEHKDVIVAIESWLLNYVGSDEKMSYIIKKAGDIKEGRSMYAETIKEFARINEKKGEIRGEKRGEKRGEIRGEKRGEIKGKISAIENMLKKDFPWDVITDITNITKSQYHEWIKNNR